jgi:UPF0716 protein FxsA
MVLFLLFIVAPLVELYVFVKTGQQIGFLNTIGIMIVVAFIGSALLKHEGRKVWVRFNEQVQSGQAPTREIADGVCVLLAGALLVAPGFVSDAVALLLLFPPTRSIFRSCLMRRKGGLGLGRTRVIRATYRQDGRGPFGPGGGVTDTTATESRGELDP